LKSIRYILEIGGYSSGCSKFSCWIKPPNPLSDLKQQIIQSGSCIALGTYARFFERRLDTPGDQDIPFVEELRVMKDAEFGPSSLCIEWSVGACDWKGMFDMK
jgi:hypothetical protein